MALTKEEVAKKLSFGLEDNDMNVTVNATHEGEEEETDESVGGEIDTTDQPEAAELDMDEAADDVEEAADKVEDLEQAEQALEALYMTALSIGAENFTPATAAMLNCAVDQTLAPFGITARDMEMPSMEEYEYSPTGSYTASMEKIGESIASAGKNAAAWAKQMWEKFVKFLSEMFDGAKRARAKTVNILKAGEKTTAQANEKITVPSFLGPDFSAKRIENFNGVLRSLITIKYADISAVVSKDNLNPLGASMAFDSAMSGVSSFTGKTYIGDIELKKGEKGVITIARSSRGDSKPSTINVPTLAEGKAIGNALLATSDHIIAYNAKSDVRKRFNDAMAKELLKEKTGDDKKSYFERRAGLREMSNLWRTTVAFEKGLIRHGITLVNMGNNALVQIMKPKKEAKK